MYACICICIAHAYAYATRPTSTVRYPFTRRGQRRCSSHTRHVHVHTHVHVHMHLRMQASLRSTWPSPLRTRPTACTSPPRSNFARRRANLEVSSYSPRAYRRVPLKAVYHWWLCSACELRGCLGSLRVVLPPEFEPQELQVQVLQVHQERRSQRLWLPLRQQLQAVYHLRLLSAG